MAIYNKMAPRPDGSVGDYRRFVVERLYHQMLRARMDEIRRQPDSPLSVAFSATRSLNRASDAFVLSAVVKQGKVEQTIEVLVTEVARALRHGFTAAELDRAKKQLVRSYQRSVSEKDKQNPRTYAREILRHHFTGEAMPGIEHELAMVERLLPTVKLDELDQLASSWVSEDNRVITISGPSTVTMPGQDAVLAAVRSATSKDIEPYREQAVAESLMARAPQAGTIAQTETIDELGVTVWTLSNGARVVLKPTDFKNDQILLSAFSPGGHSLVGEADYPSARYAAVIAGESGVGQFSATDLGKVLTGKVVQVRPYIGELEEGMSGSASPRDIETLLQLVHLRVTAPRRDAAAFAAWRERTAERLANRRLRPESAFFDDLQAFSFQNHPRRLPATAELLDQ
ncbi:MAG: insulinase family protein, partial [Myxococcota bacterium]